VDPTAAASGSLSALVEHPAVGSPAVGVAGHLDFVDVVGVLEGDEVGVALRVVDDFDGSVAGSLEATAVVVDDVEANGVGHGQQSTSETG
jgi:hypothetical protein